MARGRGQRDGSTVSNDPLLSAIMAPPVSVSPVDPLDWEVGAVQAANLMAMEDRRLYHPEGVNRPAVLPGSSDLVTRGTTSYVANYFKNLGYDLSGRRYVDRARNYVGAGLAFRDPSRVAICVRRKIRKEVIFALSPHRRIGSGKGKRRRRNWASSIRC